MSRPGGYIGYEFGDDDVYVQHIIEEKKAGAEQSKMLEHQKKMLECTETMPVGEEPVPMKSLDFEQAFRNTTLSEGYQSPYKNIPFLKEDVATVNTMSHCPPDDIAKLIRNIQNSVYTLGLDEARQCRRGKLLEVLKPVKEPTSLILRSTSPAMVSSPGENH
ncbi:CRE-LIN-52 protein [Caenorhabditis remanei]|uniref:CRE-LIN-52 protein n=2 Tax=Caenorhabditis TaxID=6237 RepID=E3LS59_CAERE|nr:CRE-LIN-52 protein [Caenorhabditis remanei]